MIKKQLMLDAIKLAASAITFSNQNKDVSIDQNIATILAAVRELDDTNLIQHTVPKYTGAVCKGAYMLNSHCGNCDKCRFMGWTK